MKTKLILASLALVGCSEAPRMQVTPMDPPVIPIENPPPPNTSVNIDVTPKPLVLTEISPKLASTLGRDRITLSGTFSGSGIEVSFGGVRAEIASVSPTQIVAYAPAGLRWGPPIDVSVRRAQDNQSISNSNAANSPTAFRYYASQLAFSEIAHINQNNYCNARVPLLGDVNGDGKVDLIASYISQGTSSVHLNNGSGNLIYTHNHNNNPTNLGVQKGMIANLNGDAFGDMLIADEGGTWQYNNGKSDGYMVNNGTGQNYYQPGCNANSPIAADFTGDNKNDVAVVCGDQNQVRIYFNTGNDGSLFGGTNSGGNMTLSTPGRPYHVMSPDLNNDGKPDLVVVAGNDGQSTLTWWFNTGNGGSPFNSSSTGQAGSNDSDRRPYWGVCGKINADAFPDCVVSDINKNTVRVFLNNGAGALQAPANADGTITVGRNPREVNLEDVNGDGKLDLLVASHENHYITIIPGDGAGAFKKIVDTGNRVLVDRIDVPTTACRYGWSAQMADFDGDGVKELVGSCQYNLRDECSYGGFRIFKNTSR